MNTLVYIIIAILFIIALVGTLFVMKNENEKIKKYEEMDQTAKDELERSHEYESHSLKRNIPSLLIIYSVVIFISIIALFFYIFVN